MVWHSNRNNSFKAGKWNNWGDIDKTGIALSVAMLTVFYGYIIKLITIFFKNTN